MHLVSLVEDGMSDFMIILHVDVCKDSGFGMQNCCAVNVCRDLHSSFGPRQVNLCLRAFRQDKL